MAFIKNNSSVFWDGVGISYLALSLFISVSITYPDLCYNNTIIYSWTIFESRSNNPATLGSPFHHPALFCCDSSSVLFTFSWVCIVQYLDYDNRTSDFVAMQVINDCAWWLAECVKCCRISRL